ncbi:MAG: hypothetical protein AABW73_02330 [Nanoarchaeota archaeon]
MSLINYLLSGLGQASLGWLKNVKDDVIFHIKREVWRIERRIIRKVVSLQIMMISALFLLLSLMFFMIDYLGVNRSLLFLIIGVLLLLLAFIINKLKEV